MDFQDKRYWPFEVLPTNQQTDQHRRAIQFLDAAHKEGLRPYVFGSESYGATAGERGGMIVFRGRNRWELLLGTTNETSLSIHIDEFNVAADAVLQWLRGVKADVIREQVQSHLVMRKKKGVGSL